MVNSLIIFLMVMSSPVPKSDPEVPEPVSNAGWLTSFAPLPFGVYDHSVVYVESLGKIYIFGGTTNGTDVLDVCYEYDIAGDLWTPKTPMPGGPRKKMAAAVVKGMIYVMGGEDGDTLVFLDRCEEYDPVGDTWNPMAPMPTPKKSHTANTWRDTLIYVMGGIKDPYPGIPLRDVEIYDPATNTWTPWDQVTGLIQARKNHSSGIIGDEIFVSAGRIGVGPCMRSTERGTIDTLNSTSITWTSMANLPFETQGGAGAALNGFFYFHAGDSCGTVRAETYRFNPRCNLWETLPDKPTPVTSISQAFVASESLLFCIGGFTGDSAAVVMEALSDTILHDLGLSLGILPDTVYPDSTYNFAVNVWNCGNVDEEYQVVCSINGYTDSIFASTLCPGETTQVFLNPWLVPPGDSTCYIISCSIEPLDGGICPDVDVDTVCTPPAIGIVEETEAQIRESRLGSLQIEPNPFSHNTSIRFTPPASGFASLRVYDLSGRLVRTLMEGKLPMTTETSSGYQSPITFVWDGKDDMGEPLSTGLYFLKLGNGSETRTMKIVLLR